MHKKASLTIIFITIFIDLVGFGIILPVLPFYALEFGASASQIGLLGASFSLMQFLFMPIWGRLSDRYGRRPILLMSLCGSTAFLICTGLANSLTALFVVRMGAGLFMANIATAQAYMADITSDEERAKGMGLLGAAFGLGFIFGPAIGGFLSGYGLATPFFAAGALAGANTICAFFLLKESRPVEKRENSPALKGVWRNEYDRFKRAVFHPVIGLLLLLFFIITLAFSNLEATFALLLDANFGYDERDNAFIFTFIGVISAIVNGGLIGPLVKKFGERKLLVTGVFTQAVSFVMLPYTESLFALLFATGLIAVGAGLTNPTLTSLISRNSGSDVQGGTLGVTQSLGALARVFGPAWGGLFFDLYGPAAPYWSGGTLLVLAGGVGLYVLLGRDAMHRVSTPPSPEQHPPNSP